MSATSRINSKATHPHLSLSGRAFSIATAVLTIRFRRCLPLNVRLDWSSLLSASTCIEDKLEVFGLHRTMGLTLWVRLPHLNLDRKLGDRPPSALRPAIVLEELPVTIELSFMPLLRR